MDASDQDLTGLTEREARVAAMAIEGAALADIAAATRTTAKAVDTMISALRRRGIAIPARKRGPEAAVLPPPPDVLAAEAGAMGAPSGRASSGAWRREEDARLIDDYNAGLAMSRTAEALGRSESAVANRLQRLRARGYPVPPRSQPARAPAQDALQAAECLRLRGEGLDVPAIAARLGRTEAWVAGRLARAERLAREGAKARPAKLAKRPCNVCGAAFQPESPFERFCDSCRRTAVREAGWALIP